MFLKYLFRGYKNNYTWSNCLNYLKNDSCPQCTYEKFINLCNIERARLSIPFFPFICKIRALMLGGSKWKENKMKK